MATGESGVTVAQAVAPEEEVILKRRLDDVGWDYGVMTDPPHNKEKIRCLLCGHVRPGGIYRLSNM